MMMMKDQALGQALFMAVISFCMLWVIDMTFIMVLDIVPLDIVPFDIAPLLVPLLITN